MGKKLQNTPPQCST